MKARLTSALSQITAATRQFLSLLGQRHQPALQTVASRSR
jgi:hypothetical protein